MREEIEEIQKFEAEMIVKGEDKGGTHRVIYESLHLDYNHITKILFHFPGPLPRAKVGLYVEEAHPFRREAS